MSHIPPTRTAPASADDAKPTALAADQAATVAEETAEETALANPVSSDHQPPGVRVAVDTPLHHLDRPFVYRLPDGMDLPELGTRVKVPFGSRRRVDGWVLGPADTLPPRVRDVIKTVSPVPAFDRTGLDLARWLADQHGATLPDALRLLLPARVAAVERRIASEAPPTPPEPPDIPPKFPEDHPLASLARLLEGLAAQSHPPGVLSPGAAGGQAETAGSGSVPDPANDEPRSVPSRREQSAPGPMSSPAADLPLSAAVPAVPDSDPGSVSSVRSGPHVSPSPGGRLGSGPDVVSGSGSGPDVPLSSGERRGPGPDVVSGSGSGPDVLLSPGERLAARLAARRAVASRQVAAASQDTAEALAPAAPPPAPVSGPGVLVEPGRTAAGPSRPPVPPLPRPAPPVRPGDSSGTPETSAARSPVPVPGDVAPSPEQVVWWRPPPDADRGELLADLVAHTVALGLGVLVVVPEVTAGSPVADAVRKRVPGIADLAGASERRRYDLCLRLARGEVRAALGGRSSVLTQLPRLGLVIVDDEASHLLKEQRLPRYHARDVAVHRAAAEGAACLLVGSVPAAESTGPLLARRWRALVPERAAERRDAPLVEAVDPDDEGPTGPRLHPRAMHALRTAVARGESAYVLVPRRGAAERLGATIRSAGQVTAELTRTLPRGTPVWRLDREAVAADETPPWAGAGPGVIVGTVAGVKDRPPLPGCRTVVVVAADAALGQAEVRAAEEALRTWWRAALWCGPREAGGRMVLQARDGGHHAVQALVRWEPAHFWRHELPRRAELGFPPVRALLLVEGPDPEEGLAVHDRLQEALGPGAELLGPAPIGRGWRTIAKVPDAGAAARALRPLLAETARAGGPRFALDVDPLEVLAARRDPAAVPVPTAP